MAAQGAPTTKTRSPNYPVISLADAVQQIQKVYTKEHTHPGTREVIARALGYGSLNGASASIVSTLRKYGLLEGAGTPEHFKVSPTALDILLHPRGDPERARAIQRAAMEPSLFSDLHGQYGSRLPSDVNLRVYLIKKGFNPKAVDNLIRIYRDTIEFVDDETQAASVSMDADQQIDDQMQSPLGQTGNADRRSDGQGNAPPPAYESGKIETALTFRVAEDCVALVQFQGNATQEGLKKLIALLNLSLDVFPKKASPKPEPVNYETSENVA